MFSLTHQASKGAFIRLGQVNLADFEAQAKQVLPRNVWNEIESGITGEVTTARNHTALRALVLQPRLLRNVQQRDLSTSLVREVESQIVGVPGD